MDKEKLIQNLEQIKKLTEECLSGFSAIIKSEIVEDKIKQSISLSGEVDFDMNERAFIKKYSKRMNGPKKFVLILAYLVKGKIEEEKPVVEIRKHWNRMTALFKARKGESGKFNTYYSTTAKDNNWVDSKKYGFWHLTSNWAEIFSKNKK